MEILIAEPKGFCFGVKRSIDMVEKALKEGKKNIQIFGPIVHNPQQIKLLEEKGVKMVNSIDEIQPGTVFVRAHGVSPEVFRKLKEKGVVDIIDATCPFVKVEQEYAKKLAEEGYQVIIIGEKNHPEALGAQGYAPGSIIIGSVEEARALKEVPKIGAVVQTTLEPEAVDDIVAELYHKAKEVRVFNTICQSTKMRQPAAKKVAEQVDLMIVVGGKNSGNTRRLAEVCSRIKPTYHIETAAELKKEWFEGMKKVGISAGASTPEFIIDEVIEAIKKMDGSSKKTSKKKSEK
ncbi:MAG: 4-hydroxy-3-methylbut-2-enyl diphosphate reductase [Candidatus Micrarchaeota archaeon]|nr:4-hydroxy-3-methylbut-2-enyl diphosphate reductase [Candidatus Micrarchaeota archaeon]